MSRWKTFWSSLAALVLAASLPAAVAAQGAPPAPAQPAAATATAAVADDSYVIGTGDTVEIEMPDRPDFNAHPKVDADGNIELPLVGNIAAANRTALALRDQIKAALVKGGFFTNPNLTVRVAGAASRYVTVLGAANQNGLVPLDRTYHLSEILAKVGGIRDGGADYVIIRPAKGPTQRLLVKDVAIGERGKDPVISPGDTIYVPTAEVFYISGQVKSPGSYGLMPDMTIRQAIGRGGGLTDLGSDRGVKVTRSGKTTQASLDAKIQAGDVIVVGERLF